MLKKELINEIDVCLQRNDLSHIDFVYLHSLKYLIAKADEIMSVLCAIAGLVACGLIVLISLLAFE